MNRCPCCKRLRSMMMLKWPIYFSPLDALNFSAFCNDWHNKNVCWQCFNKIFRLLDEMYDSIYAERIKELQKET